MRLLATGLASGLLLIAAPAAGPAASTLLALNVPHPTNIVVDAHHALWITSGGGGPAGSDGVWYLPSGAKNARHVAGGLHTALGLTWFQGSLYVGSISSPSAGIVTRLSGFTGTTFKTRKRVLRNLPIGRHTVDTIVPGPGQRLYVGVGSEQDNKGRAGRVLSFRADGSGVKLEATGLRNPYGLAFVPHSSELLITDNARDDLGAFKPPDELDALDVNGPVRNFGFPRCYGQGGSACKGKVSPLVNFGAHASSDGLAITANGKTAYIAENGSSFTANPTGSDVQKVTLSGKPAHLHAHRSLLTKDFASHDPLGAAVGPGNALYITRFGTGGVKVLHP